jgi:hypothetical protein
MGLWNRNARDESPDDSGGTIGAFFVEFIASGYRTNHDGIGEALADTEVASISLQYSPYQRQWGGIPAWSPHGLGHAAASEFGEETTRLVLAWIPTGGEMANIWPCSNS